VLGNSDRLTAGNDAYVTAGLKEDAVFGFLLTVLLGGNTEVALNRICLDGTLTKFFGEKMCLEAVNQRLAAQEATAVGLDQRITAFDAAYRAQRAEAAVLHEATKGYEDLTLAQMIQGVANDVLTVANYVAFAVNVMRCTDTSTELAETAVKIGNVETELAGICGIV
jgi:hypothetical protein